MDKPHTEAARGATSPSGGFALHAPAPGRYHVLIRRIGQYPWRSPFFTLEAGITYPVTFRVDSRPYELPALTVDRIRLLK